MTTLNWNLNSEDRQHVERIAERAMESNLGYPDQLTAQMDVTAVHLNGCPLRLDEFAEADAFNFTHDMAGIAAHLDRETGNLTRHFLPRFSKRRAS